VKEMKAAPVLDDSVDQQKEAEYVELLKKNEKLCGHLNVAQQVYQYELQFKDEHYRDNFVSILESKIPHAQKTYAQSMKNKEETDQTKREDLVDKEVQKLTREKQIEWENKVEDSKKRVETRKEELRVMNEDKLAKTENMRKQIAEEKETVKLLNEEIQRKKADQEQIIESLKTLRETKVNLENTVVEKHSIYKNQIEDHEREWKKEELLMSIGTQNHERLKKLYEDVLALRSEQIQYLQTKSKYDRVMRKRESVTKELMHYHMLTDSRELLFTLADKAIDIASGIAPRDEPVQLSSPLERSNSTSKLKDMKLQSPMQDNRSSDSQTEVATPVQKSFTTMSQQEIDDVLAKSYPYDKKNILALVVDYLKSGSVMKIHSRGRRPRRFLFTISEDLQSLCWKDENFANMENVTVYTLPLLAIKAVSLGQYSDTFKQSQFASKEDDFYYSFSLLHSSDKTIDMTSMNCFDFEAWILGLSAILGLRPQWGKPLKNIGPNDLVTQFTPQEIALCENCHVLAETYWYLKGIVDNLKQNRRPDISRGQMRVLSQLDILRSDRLYAFLYRPQQQQ
jgi:hypothetical protein